MAVGEKRRRKVRGRRGERSRYLFTADQVLRKTEAGILPEDEKIKLFDGVLSIMTKGELQNAIVRNLSEILRGVVSKQYHILNLGKYAVAGIPIYWILEVDRRRVLVHTDPETVGGIGRCGRLATFKPGDSLAVAIGGEVLDRIAVSVFFPPEPQNRP